MADLVLAQPISLKPSLRRWVSPDVAIDPLTATIRVRLRRPTTLAPLAWDATGTVRVSILVTLDGVQHRSSAGFVGGIRTFQGQDRAFSSLTYTPTWGYFGVRSGFPKRLGETQKTSFTAHVELEWVAGSVTTELDVVTTERPAPAVPFHSSVTVDNRTDTAVEESGDGVVSLTHTAGGGAGSNRAVFAGSLNLGPSAGINSTGTTYGGTSMTEMWDDTEAVNNLGHAGYQWALGDTLTGAQTVTNTLAASNPTHHYLQVISFIGVHQTTPVGTAQHTTAADTTSPVSLTVSDAGADDVIVDSLVMYGLVGPTIGADQTLENTAVDSGGTVFFRGSSQPGTADDVMSWTSTNFIGAFLGAVAFKAAAGGAASVVTPRLLALLGVGA